eukprot:TRINITY_DN1829_c0_g1_i1.p1 TRINITY_DN1829_c0_g1~~TRINITY_DN1829_c0_g1_i1.p1  ORF type:complete len:357 (-),score=100.40 TRINITY_DN1829_c0_g1_i1:149-1219(-)
MKALSILPPVRSTLSATRGFATVSEAKAARFTANGVASKVLRIEKEALPSDLKPDQVLVKVLAAPIHSLDIANISGLPGSFTTPGVPGSEGVGEVLAVGSNVQNLKPKDWVVTVNPKLGTWRTHLVASSSDLVQVPQDIPLEAAATLAITPPTALHLLNDFVKLQSGDFLIQNGGNSAVATHVTELASARGIKAINVIRKRSEYETSSARLQGHGAYIVVTPEYLRLPKFFDLLEGERPKLGLNLTGGPIATDIARTLAPSGTLVTYSGASSKPVTIPTSLLVSKNLTLKGFSYINWLAQRSAEEKKKVIADVLAEVKEGRLRTYVERHRFEDLQHALKANSEPQKSRKVLLVFDK